jgi:hypothetical protein
MAKVPSRHDYFERITTSKAFRRAATGLSQPPHHNFREMNRLLRQAFSGRSKTAVGFFRQGTSTDITTGAIT